MTQDRQATYAAIDAWIDQHFDEQVRFLQALVQVPTDTCTFISRRADLRLHVAWSITQRGLGSPLSIQERRPLPCSGNGRRRSVSRSRRLPEDHSCSTAGSSVVAAGISSARLRSRLSLVFLCQGTAISQSR